MANITNPTIINEFEISRLFLPIKKIDKFFLRESFGRVLSCYWQSYVMNSAKQGRKRPAVDGFVR